MHELFETKIAKLFKIFPVVENLSRKKCFFQLLFAFIKSRNVQFWYLAEERNAKVKILSNLRRIQRFFEQVSFDYEALAQVLVCFLPAGKLRLCLDRTEWNFGYFEINILVLSACFRGIGLPLYFELLDNRSGNSSVTDRVDWLEKALALLGKDRIDCIIGDREFIGVNFYNYLLINQLHFYLRIRKNQYVEINEQKLRVDRILGDRPQAYADNIKIDNFDLSLALSRTKNKQ